MFGSNEAFLEDDSQMLVEDRKMEFVRKMVEMRCIAM